MFIKAFATALVSTTLIAGAFQTPAFADAGGGGGGDGAGYQETHTLTFTMPPRKKLPSASSTERRSGVTTTARGNADGSRTNTRTNRNGRVLDERTGRPDPRPSMSSTDRNTGVTTTVRTNPDGSRTVTKTNRKGRVISEQRRSGPGANRPWASAYDPDTGTRTTSVGLNRTGSVRAVFSVGPLGIGFGFSR